MQKLIVVLLAVYIAILACYPCGDQDTCVDERQTHAEVSVEDHEHSSDELDLCSPFCICSCCNAHMNQPRLVQFTFLVPVFADTVTHFRPGAMTTVTGTIWQPPKIA